MNTIIKRMNGYLNVLFLLDCCLKPSPCRKKIFSLWLIMWRQILMKVIWILRKWVRENIIMAQVLLMATGMQKDIRVKSIMM